MAADIFLKLPGIDGESADAKHPKEIEVIAWSWAVSNSGAPHSGGGGGVGRAVFSDLSVTKLVDVASPTLALFVANDKHIPTATLTVRRGGDRPVDYLTIELADVVVTSVTDAGSSVELRPTEQVTFGYAKIKETYLEQRPDGSAGSTTEFTWDLKQNHP